MKYTLTPVEFEIYDGTSLTLAARVKMFDENAASIEIKMLHNLDSFNALVPHIREALDQMELEGDK